MWNLPQVQHLDGRLRRVGGGLQAEQTTQVPQPRRKHRPVGTVRLLLRPGGHSTRIRLQKRPTGEQRQEFKSETAATTSIKLFAFLSWRPDWSCKDQELRWRKKKKKKTRKETCFRRLRGNCKGCSGQKAALLRVILKGQDGIWLHDVTNVTAFIISDPTKKSTFLNLFYLTQVQIFAEVDSLKLQLAMNTQQFGRTFEDRWATIVFQSFLPQLHQFRPMPIKFPRIAKAGFETGELQQHPFLLSSSSCCDGTKCFVLQIAQICHQTEARGYGGRYPQRERAREARQHRAGVPRRRVRLCAQHTAHTCRRLRSLPVRDTNILLWHRRQTQVVMCFLWRHTMLANVPLSYDVFFPLVETLPKRPKLPPLILSPYLRRHNSNQNVIWFQMDRVKYEPAKQRWSGTRGYRPQ